MKENKSLISKSKNNLFRKNALQNLSAHEKLDELFIPAKVNKYYYICAVLFLLTAFYILFIIIN